MGFVRIYFDNDYIVQGIFFPESKKNLSQDDFDKIPVAKAYTHYYSKIIDSSLIPTGDDYTQQLYFDGEQIKLNEEKDKALMPLHIIRAKCKHRINRKIDVELAKEAPDQIIIARLQHEKEARKQWTQVDWYMQALRNLDEDGHSKPIIRQKLAAKIQELTK